jgi:hypothetical protein
MPTGYTAALVEGEQPFDEFVLDCSRAMGAAIMQRDAGAGPTMVPPLDVARYDNEIQDYITRLEELDEMPEHVQDKARRAEFADRLVRYQAELTKTAQVAERLNRRIEEVEAWEPPTEDHANFKAFMLDQLHETLKYDGTVSDFYLPVLPTPQAWFDREVKSAKDHLTWQWEYRYDEAERWLGRKNWIVAVYDSVGRHVNWQHADEVRAQQIVAMGKKASEQIDWLDEPAEADA